jgi:hypothetical protein
MLASATFAAGSRCNSFFSLSAMGRLSRLAIAGLFASGITLFENSREGLARNRLDAGLAVLLRLSIE